RGLEDAGRSKLELLGKIAHAEAELLAAWERSKKPRQRTRGKKVEGGGRARGQDRREAETVTEGRDGNPKVWTELRQLGELKARILGLMVQQHEHAGKKDGEPIPVKAVDVFERIREHAEVFRQLEESNRQRAAGAGGGPTTTTAPAPEAGGNTGAGP